MDEHFWVTDEVISDDEHDYLEIILQPPDIPEDEKLSLEELKEYAKNGELFTSRVDQIRENSLDYLRTIDIFMSTLASLLQTFDTEAVIVLLDENSKLEQVDYAPFYIHMLLNYKQFTTSDFLFLFSIIRGKYAETQNGERIDIPVDLRTTKQEIFLELLGLDSIYIRNMFIIVDQIYQMLEGSADITMYQRLREIQFEYPSKTYPLDDLLVERIVKRSPFIVKPSYLIESPKSNLEFAMKAEIEISDIYSLGLDQMPKRLREYLVLHPQEMQDFREKYAKTKTRLNLAESPLLSQILGPANRMARDDLTGDDICSIFGGCRMLICPCLVAENEKWFNGYCENCLKKIPYEHWAVRQPRIQGCWSGCYCSFDCTREFIEDNALFQDLPPVEDTYTDDEIEELKEMSKVLPLYSLSEIEKKIMEWGIFDREEII